MSSIEPDRYLSRKELDVQLYTLFSIQLDGLQSDLDQYLDNNGVYSQVWDRIQGFYDNKKAQNAIAPKIFEQLQTQRVVGEMLDSLNQRRDLCDGISPRPRRPALPPTSDQWYLGFNV